MKSFLLLLPIILSVSLLRAQVPIGQWQDYLSFYQVHSVKKVNDKIYAATDVGLFSYDTQEYVLEKITKINGLSDVELSAIGASSDSKILLVGYANGKIDLVSEESITNIPDLFLKDLNVSKRINHIYFINNKAFCATDFGIVVVDIIKNEISDSYIIGENASNLKINQITTANDTIFAATERGILAAPSNSNSLAFYETWDRISVDTKEYVSIVSFNDKLISCRKNGSAGEILEYNNGQWINKFTQSNFVGMELIQSQLALISPKKITIYNSNLNPIAAIDSYTAEGDELLPSFTSIYVDENNIQWIGDASNGLIQISTPDIQIVPDGPTSNNSYKLKATPNALWTVMGTPHQIAPIFIRPECSIYRNGGWTRLTANNNAYLKNAYNLNDIAIDPLDENHVFISSAHSGIFELLNDEIIEQYTETNSAIEKAYIWRLVNGLVMDNEGNLFANNQSDFNPIVVKPKIVTDTNSENNFGWYRYNYASYGTDSDPWLHQTVYTSWGHFWAMSFRNPDGLFVYDIGGTIDDTSDDRYRYAGNNNNTGNSKLLIWDEEGKVINTTVTCLAEDKSGYMWIGTDAGILVYYRPRDIFNIDKPIASRIKIPRNDGSGFADYLLESEQISTIVVDGANRKWIGTTSNGVYLVSEDGTQTILEFNKSNSPLLSNNIKSIAINPQSGEVFIATDKGILSYRGTATEGQVAYASSAKAFPNPVKPNYEGVITVTGLIENSSIRITDISGKIVHQAVSTGGQVVWNGKNMYNQKVSSGVYLVFATNEDGSESMVTKIMIIR